MNLVKWQRYSAAQSFRTWFESDRYAAAFGRTRSIQRIQQTVQTIRQAARQLEFLQLLQCTAAQRVTVKLFELCEQTVRFLLESGYDWGWGVSAASEGDNSGTRDLRLASKPDKKPSAQMREALSALASRAFNTSWSL